MSMIDENSIMGIMFIFARLSGCIALNPIFGRRNVPSMVQVAISLVLSLLLYAFEPLQLEVSSTIEFMVLISKEVLVGLALGFIVSLISNIIVVGGELIDFQIGLSMAKVFDAQTDTSIALSSTLFNIAFMFMFFLGDGHLTLIKFFLDSSKIVPYGQMAFGQEIAQYMMDLFCDTTVLAMKMAMPIIGIGFMVEMGVGILMKIIPQINVFVINIQLKIFIGLICILLFYYPFISFLERLIELMFDAIRGSMQFMS